MLNLNKSDLEYYFNYSKTEVAEVEELRNSFKVTKLKNLFRLLIEKENWDFIESLLNNNVEFYQSINTKDVFEKSIEEISQSLFKCEKEIDVILNLENTKNEFIQNFFIDNVIKNINERSSIPKIRRDPYDYRLIDLANKLLLKNPKYVDKFKDVLVDDFHELIIKIDFNHNLNIKLDYKNNKINKLKI